ncbi:proteasome subunit alpha [Candidatus Methylacidithermus pantelleriae]|uniref:20S proteasome, alpha subunit n=1 Tax=Candidatus Methylacidithermus pantelleriae TaxID=2744239 RepID=A0A8J2FTE4_9BACT|nr:proteasome subunit alpha [Candidatus Methylacidithermus pantelleriae]CAF0704428.1 20S proteasome, alpha subunit [Candidatus Methylacidithermus pantelleriae]
MKAPESPAVAGVSVLSPDGDFVDLLRKKGVSLFSTPPESGLRHDPSFTSGATTVVAFYYREGALIAGDRRATAGNLVIYDRAEKVLEIDRYAVLAIAGTPATAYEMARVLQHSVEFYRRSQLQPLSLEAKVRMLGKLLKDNLGWALQGVGMVVPILVAVDALHKGHPQIFFYDALGAQFQAVDFATSGSGSLAVRSVLHYINRWSGYPTHQRGEKEAIALALQLLEVAAQSDTATGGVDRRSGVYPQIKLVREGGVQSIPEERVREAYREMALEMG